MKQPAKHQNLISASGFKNHTPVSFNGNQIGLDLEFDHFVAKRPGVNSSNLNSDQRKI